jgi:hypothetical protein
VPSAPGPINSRPEAENPTARREYESFDWYEEISGVLAAGTAFVELGTFSGKPDRIRARVSASSADIRLRNPGEAAGSPIRVRLSEDENVYAGSRIVEARDPAGAGGATVFVTGFFHSRHIDRRESRRGPTLSDVRARAEAPPEQIEPRY